MRKFLRFLLAGCLLAMVVLPLLPQKTVFAADWGTVNGFNSRIVISFNSVNQTENLTAFVVDVFLDSTKVNFSDFQANGADIRFVDKDDVTQLPADNLTWSASSQAAHLRVKVPQIDAYSNYTDYIFMYYNKPGASANFSSNGVWSGTDAIGVWELFRTSNNSTTIKDSTSLANNLTTTNTTYSSTGHIFGGTNSKASKSVANFAATNTTGTIMGWAKTGSTSGAIFGSGDNVGFNNLSLYQNTQGGEYQRSTAGGIIAVVGSTGLNDSKFHLVAVSSNSTKYIIGTDGILQNKTVISGSDSGVWFNNTPIERDTIDIGALNSWGYSYWWPGTIGEVRVYGSEKSIPYQLYSYRSSQYAFGLGDGGFLRYGNSIPEPSVSTLTATNITMDKDGNTSVTLSGNLTSLGGTPVSQRWNEYGLTLSSDNTTYENIATINSTARSTYGLSYPLTYIYSIPVTASNMSVTYRKTSSGTWSNLIVKTASDIFNGIDAVRFDYVKHRAYVSLGFGQTENTLRFRFYENGILETKVAFIKIPTYYDDRTAAVVITVDDTQMAPISGTFAQLTNNFTSRNLWATYAIVADQSTNWSEHQTALNGGEIEIASHSMTHPGSEAEYLAQGGYEYQIQGSKAAITGNLTLPNMYSFNGTEYVPLYVLPSGFANDAIRSQVGTSKYLIIREPWFSTPGLPYNTYTLKTWDTTYSTYSSSNTTTTSQTDNLTWLNGGFDTAYTAGGVYHTWFHPYILNLSSTNVSAHFDYISNRADVWYVGFGALYMYQYAKDRSNIQEPAEISSIGTYQNIVTGLTPGQTYRTRAGASNAIGVSYGSDANFTLSSPSITTLPMSPVGTNIAQFHGTLNNLGSATSIYYTFQYSEGTGFDYNTGWVASSNATANFTAVIYPPAGWRSLNSRLVARVGSTYIYGSSVSQQFDNANSNGGIALAMLVVVMLMVEVQKMKDKYK